MHVAVEELKHVERRAAVAQQTARLPRLAKCAPVRLFVNHRFRQMGTAGMVALPTAIAIYYVFVLVIRRKTYLAIIVVIHSHLSKTKFK